MNKLPLIKQSERAECGLACLAMVLNYHGFETNLLELRKKYQLSTAGLTLDDLAEIANNVSLSSRALRLELDSLSELKTPCILHWDMNHFVVLKKVKGCKVVVHDPSKGVCELELEQVSKHFTGVALELHPMEKFEKKKSKPLFSIYQLWRGVSDLKSSLGKVVLLSLFLQFFVLLGPFYLQVIIDRVIPTSDHSLLMVVSIGFFLVLVFQQLISLLRTFIIVHLGATFSAQTSNSVFKHLLSLPLEYFEKRDVGDVVSRFDSLQKIKNFLTTGFIEAAIDGVMALSLLALMFYYDAKLTLVVLFFVIVYIVYRAVTFKAFRRLQEKEISSRAIERSDFIENIQNMQTVMAFDAQRKRLNQWNNHHVNFINSSTKVKQTKASYQMINGFIFGIENILIFYFLADGVLNNQLTIGVVTAYVAYKRIFSQRLTTLLDKLIEYWMLSLHIDRLSDIVLSEPVQDSKVNINADFHGYIDVKDVSFSYSDFAEPVLTNINFKLKPGEYVALVGPSGAGKSTLLKLMLGLLTPSNGKILIDGRDVEEYGKQNFRSQIATVLQNDKLYKGSILDNITFFDPHPDLQWAIECAKMAQVHRTINSKPMSYNSLIGNMGTSLSGGEQQRLIVARALYKKPKVLFMDEATSSLDIFTEKTINQAISTLNITRVVVAHRPQAIKSAERVLKVTKDGVIELDKAQLENKGSDTKNTPVHQPNGLEENLPHG